MSRFFLHLGLALMAAGSAHAQVVPQSIVDRRPRQEADARSRAVDSLFAPWVARNGPGVAVLVMQRGRVLHMKGYGYADVAARTPITSCMLFDLASLTKQFTAMAVMQLAQQGKLRYSDSLTHYFPEFREHGAGVTLRDLLNHTSGLADYIRLFRNQGAAYNAFPRPERGGNGVAEPSMAEVIAMVAREPLRYPPGRGWEYSNSGYLMLAGVVEKVAGVPFPQYVRDQTLRPLGMRATLFSEGNEGAPGRAHSYFPAQGAWRGQDYTPLERVQGAVGVVSNLEDLSRWYAALDASSLVRPEVQREGFTTGYLETGQPAEYGFGWIIGNTLGLERQSHGGWWKGFRNVVLRFPGPAVTVVLLSNDAGFAPFRNFMAFRTARIYLQGSMVLPDSVALPQAALARLAGTYRDGTDEYPVRLESGSLWMTIPDGTRMRLVPSADGAFFVDGVEERRVTFAPDPDGTGIRLIYSEFGTGSTTHTWTVARRSGR